jgi:hypothetical protein
MSLEVCHRPETGTPIKNKFEGERFIALNDETCAVLDAWLEKRRPDTPTSTAGTSSFPLHRAAST